MPSRPPAVRAVADLASRYPALAALESATPSALPPLALKLCAGCTGQFAVEGDVGDEQGGTPWFCARCPVPPSYQDQYIRRAVSRG